MTLKGVERQGNRPVQRFTHHKELDKKWNYLKKF